jgi:hypothetical protein
MHPKQLSTNYAKGVELDSRATRGQTNELPVAMVKKRVPQRKNMKYQHREE